MVLTVVGETYSSPAISGRRQVRRQLGIGRAGLGGDPAASSCMVAACPSSVRLRHRRAGPERDRQGWLI